MPADASAHVDTTTTGAVDVLHRIPGIVVTVSSTVANDAHLPRHLVDGDLSTAWNSRTGELVGSWIKIELPTKTKLTAIKLTAGFTGHGPHGEDWFAMNYRIRRIRVLADSKPVGEFELDVARRDLQSIPIDVEASSMRVDVVGVTPGTQKDWMEACISELELWGIPSAEVSARKLNLEVRVDAQRKSCPDETTLARFVTTASSVAKNKKGKLFIHACRAGKFPSPGLYVTAAFVIPPPPPPPQGADNPLGLPSGSPFPEAFYILGVFDYDGRNVALLERAADVIHPWEWNSVTLKDLDADGIDEAIEEKTGGGGVRRKVRVIYKVVGKEIKEQPWETIGSYEDGVYHGE